MVKRNARKCYIFQKKREKKHSTTTFWLNLLFHKIYKIWYGNSEIQICIINTSGIFFVTTIILLILLFHYYNVEILIIIFMSKNVQN